MAYLSVSTITLDEWILIGLCALTALIGLASVVAGYRLHKLTCFAHAYMFVQTAVHLILTVHHTLPSILSILIAFVIACASGTLLLVLCFAVDRFAFLLYGFFASIPFTLYSISTVYVLELFHLFKITDDLIALAVLLTLLVVSILAATLCAVFRRPVFIILSSLNGATFIASSIDICFFRSTFKALVLDLLGGDPIPRPSGNLSLFFVAGIVILTQASVLFQFRVTAFRWSHHKETDIDRRPLLIQHW